MANPRLEIEPAVDEAEVRRKAFELWQARGCPVGSPEEDWFQALRLLRSRQSEAPQKSGVHDLPLGLRFLDEGGKAALEARLSR